MRLIDMAVGEAVLSSARYRHGAVVVNNGRVIATGRSRKVMDPIPNSTNHWRGCSVHAEEDALTSAPRSAYVGATLIVARVGRDGSLRPSAPCKRCAGLLRRRGIRRVIHT